MTESVLLLNADYTPLRLVSWKRAIGMVLEDKVSVVTEYTGRFIRSASLSLGFPAVVVLRSYTVFRGRVRFNRHNVFARDAWVCQYCGRRPRRPEGSPDFEHLTIDHVVPRAQASKGMVTLPWSGKRVPITCWQNVTTACVRCNNGKADRTPREAGMGLRRAPRVPSHRDLLRMAVWDGQTPPPEWQAWFGG